MAYGYNIEAEYLDGYIHSEAELNDTSPYLPGKNIFNDILEHRPEKKHGKLVRLSLINDGIVGNDFKFTDYHIDWRDFPPDAKPIYYRKMERMISVGGLFMGDAYATNHYFGYEYHLPDGTKVKEINEL